MVLEHILLMFKSFLTRINTIWERAPEFALSVITQIVVRKLTRLNLSYNANLWADSKRITFYYSGKYMMQSTTLAVKITFLSKCMKDFLKGRLVTELMISKFQQMSRCTKQSLIIVTVAKLFTKIGLCWTITRSLT